MENLELQDFDKVFLGACCSIGLKKRGPDDPHVCFYFLVEDDENWFVSQNGISSFWIPDFNQVWAQAQEWILANCDPDEEDGTAWGYKFRARA